MIKTILKSLLVLIGFLMFVNVSFADTLQVTIPTVLAPTAIPVAPLTIYTPITTSPTMLVGAAIEMMNGSTVQDLIWTTPRYVVPITATNSPNTEYIQAQTAGFSIYTVAITCGNQDLSSIFNLPTGSVLFNSGGVCPTPTITPTPSPTPVAVYIPQYTVATEPPCNSSSDGNYITVTDTNLITCNVGFVVAGGFPGNYCTAVCKNGTGWVHP